MRRSSFVLIVSFITACGGGSSSEGGGGDTESSATTAEGGGGATTGGEEAGDDGPADNEFQLNHGSADAGEARGERPSEIEATETEAAMRLFVVNGEDVPIPGVVIKMTAPNGNHYFTQPTDSHGYAEVLVPISTRYEMEYLSLGRRNTTATVEVPDGPRRDVRLTLRYRQWRPPAPPEDEPGFRLDGVNFETSSARIDRGSYPRLDRVVEYLEHKPDARIRVSGHTDNVGNPRANQRLSEQRAQAVREYLVSKGIAGDRIEAVGYGDTQPLASNDSDEGRARNRRIEAIEL
ncbi:MAG: OmpA family protein [Deltaproteobacteria bacterium]|nr:OmpA family protein [Deltaproteobacteria bacterium]